jgi:DNA-directed RNA polymerase subunit RPC12/RpoP
MYICLNCKKQFNSGMTSNGECPYCGTINILAQNRKKFEKFTIQKNNGIIRKLQGYFDKIKRNGM